ncbi:MAG: DUF2585 family protein [Candidatus Pacebacteria bacterium]|nr:DUF2585 family protein [Candidatus Paceibacterota bacterium]
MLETIKLFLKKHRFVIISTIIVCGATGLIELSTGRSLLGPDGKFGWWDGDIWGSENSQRVADAYSFSHIIHGMLFYGFLWLIAVKFNLPRFVMKYRYLGAILLEAGWELLENSPIIINRYREATIAQGYVGDSVLNSVSDIGMVIVGFIIARYAKVWMTILLIVAFEVGCLFWVRDNLTLNVLMLVHPVESVKVWQAEGKI